jgi:hypothetical protein
MNRIARGVAGSFLALALCITAACGSSGPKDNGVAKLTASEILAKAKEALQAAKSVHLTGTSKQGTETFELDLRISQSGSAIGTIKVNGDAASLIRIGDALYFKADTGFYTKNGAPAAAAALLAGKYLKTTVDNKDFAEFKQFTDMKNLAATFLTPDGTAEKVAGKPIRGQETVGLQDTVDGKNTGRLYIATKGKAYPLAVEPPPEETGKFELIDYDADVTASAPPTDQVVDFALLQQLGGGQ